MIDIVIRCKNCGHIGQVEIDEDGVAEIPLCPICTQVLKDNVRYDNYRDAYTEGYNDGLSDGYKQGLEVAD